MTTRLTPRKWSKMRLRVTMTWKVKMMTMMKRTKLLKTRAWMTPGSRKMKNKSILKLVLLKLHTSAAVLTPLWFCQETVLPPRSNSLRHLPLLPWTPSSRPILSMTLRRNRLPGPPTSSRLTPSKTKTNPTSPPLKASTTTTVLMMTAANCEED